MVSCRPTVGTQGRTGLVGGDRALEGGERCRLRRSDSLGQAHEYGRNTRTYRRVASITFIMRRFDSTKRMTA